MWVLSVTIAMLSSCGTDSIPKETGPCSGDCDLSGVMVNSFSVFKGDLYAATDSGLYRSPLEEEHLAWSSLGLQEENVIDVVFLPDNKMLAAIRIPDFSEGFPSLYITVNDGENWLSFMNNYGGKSGKYTWVESLASVSIPSDTIFARSGGATVVRSINGGKEWNIVNGDWNLLGGAALLIKPDSYKTGRIWAGGVNAFSLPYLLKSDDYGETWKELTVLEDIEAVCYDVISNPTKVEHLIVGLDGAIEPSRLLRKTTDGGESWQTVFEGFGIRTLAHSIQDSGRIYASGRNKSGTLFFLESTDFGDTWQEVEILGAPDGLRVNDLVAVEVDSQEVLYFATNKGVYSYRFGE